VRRYRADLQPPPRANRRAIALAVIIAATLSAIAAILPMTMTSPFA
jgi:hypothetical protein